MNLIALHSKIMSNNPKQRVIIAQADLIARLTKSLYGGAKIVYDDKASTLEMIKYGLFLKAQKNFLIGFEYNQTGENCSIDASINHKVDVNTQIASLISYDYKQNQVSATSVVEKRFLSVAPSGIETGVLVKARINNLGVIDTSVTGNISP